MIVLVAPYSGYNSSGKIDLGASKKIRFVISVLSKISGKIILINSAHNLAETQSTVKRQIVIDGISVTEVILPTKKKRPVGKFLNLLDADEIVQLLENGTLGNERPQLFWFYNAYAFEMILAKKIAKRFSSPLVLEFEDWHFSRSRGVSIKPWVDFYFWKKAAHLFSKTYAVNSFLYEEMSKVCKNTSPLPGVVPQSLIQIRNSSKPFSAGNIKISVGYFGGLKEEKGAGIVLQLADLLPDNFDIHVTGFGPLASDFEQKSSIQKNLKYHGMVSDSGLTDIIAKCDIILNPHQPLESFQNGLFPFKVIEAIASGRMLISTKLSFSGFEGISNSVKFSDFSAEAFSVAIQESYNWYVKNESAIRDSSQTAIDLFSEESIINDLESLIKKKETSSLS